MKKILLCLLFIAGTALGASQEYSQNIPWSRAIVHQTTNTAWNPVTQTCVLNSLVICVSNAGTSWVVTVQDGETPTPMILYKATVVVGTTQPVALPVGILMTSGINVTFSGTAGVADLWAVYR